MSFRLHSYVVARDYGFAPNPFFGVCTLATCKPVIRRIADLGDWIVGTSGSHKGGPVRLIFAMRVGETLSFDEYWSDLRFADKKPNLATGKKRAFGDNIYHHVNGTWRQERSHHAYADGTCNQNNLDNDTKADRVLVGDWFVYFGENAPLIPHQLRDFDGCDLYAGRGQKNNAFSGEMVNAVVGWIRSLGVTGYAGDPRDWPRSG